MRIKLDEVERGVIARSLESNRCSLDTARDGGFVAWAAQSALFAGVPFGGSGCPAFAGEFVNARLKCWRGGALWGVAGRI